jgi:AcrR family transcriptional regulator
MPRVPDNKGPQKGLPRGPQALPRAEVAARQRERLFEAMVQAVDEHGFAASTVSDLVARAGVSTRTFYEHFPNKEECLLYTYDTVTEDLARRMLAAQETAEDWPAQLEAILRALFTAISERPDVARLVCVEMGASGPTGVRRWADGNAAFAAFVGEGFAQSEGPGPIPDPIARAIVGAVRHIIYTRVRRERSSKALRTRLIKTIPDLMTWINGFYPSPPEVPLRPIAESPPALAGGRAPGTLSPPSLSGARGLPRGEHNLPRGFVEHHQRERIFDAIARLTATKGYGALSLDEIASQAAVSLQTFYAHFESKEEAFLATYEVGHTRAMAAVNRSLASEKDWIHGVRVGARALLEFLAAEPAYAHMACVDILTVYSNVANRVDEANSSYANLLDLGLGEGAPASSPVPVVTEAIVGGVFELLHDYVLHERARELPELADHVGYIALTPFIGSEAAAQAIFEAPPLR